MAQPLNNQRLIIILSAVLLAALVMGVIIYFLLPSTKTTDTTQTTASSNSFDLSVTQRSGYARLNIRPIQEGALPVAPPAGVGKANPFL